MTITSKTAMDKAGQETPKHKIYADFDNLQLLTKNQKAVMDYQNILSMLALRHLVETDVIDLVTCTGRVFNQIHRDINSGEFSRTPFPVAAKTKTIISGVGTEIHHLNKEGVYIEDAQWKAKLEASGFREAFETVLDRQDANETTDKTVQLCRNIQNELGRYLKLQPQEDDKNTPFKKSLWARADETITEAALSGAISQVLGDQGQHINVTISMQTKTAIDLTPKGINKQSACLYLMNKTNIARENTYMAGDSENDSHCTDIAGVNILLPGNAQDALIKKVNDAHTAQNIFQAKEGRDAAAGLIDGFIAKGIITTEQAMHAYNGALSTIDLYKDHMFLRNTGPTPRH